jgi:hypothetical protein
MVDLRAFLRYAGDSIVNVELGARLSFFEELRICIWGPCNHQTGALLGPYFEIALGSRRFKLGPRVEWAVRTDDRETGVLFYPLFFHVEFPQRD